MSEIICFVEASRTGAGIAAVRAAQKMGFLPVVLCKSVKQYAFLEGSGAILTQVNTSEISDLMGAIAALAQQHTICGVGSTSDSGIVEAARLAEHLSLPTSSSRAVGRCRNKRETRIALKGSELNPGFECVTDLPVAISAAIAMGYPVIVKPTSLTGSACVRKCGSEQDVVDAFRAITEKLNNPRPEVLVEEFVDGEEYSVEILDFQVLGVTGKRLGPPPSFIETFFVSPAGIDEGLEESIKSAALNALDIVGLSKGPAHVELKVSSRGIRIIEINARLAGLWITELIELASGISLADRYVASLTGRQATPDRHETVQAAAVQYVLVPEDKSILNRIDADSAKQSPGFSRIISLASAGEIYARTGSNWDIAFGVVATGETPTLAAKNASEAAGKVICIWSPVR